MDLNLGGKTVVVTGGSRGIGRAVVLGLLAEGANVGTCARHREDLAALTAQAGADAPLLWEALDVREPAAVARFMLAVATRFGGIDGLVVNAGAGTTGGVLSATDDDFRTQFDIKVGAALGTVRAALPYLRRSATPRVVIINAVTAHAPEAGLAAVGAARSALSNVGVLLAEELAPEGICVNRLNLGPIVTDRQRAAYDASGTTQSYADGLAVTAVRRGVPLGRMGDVAEVVPWVLLLLSPLAGYVTGADLAVAGGLGMRV